VYGKTVGDGVEFGGLSGHAPIMAVSKFSSSGFIQRGGRIPAPVHSFRNKVISFIRISKGWILVAPSFTYIRIY
jgi:hypothetical protein